MLKNSCKLIRFFIICFVMTALIGALYGCGKSELEVPLQLKKQEDQRLARINIKDYGAVTIRLLAGEEPDVVNEFINKAKSHFYDGTRFYNIIEDYLMIGGREESVSLNDDETDKDNSDIRNKEADPKRVKAQLKGNLYPFRGALCANLLSDGTCSPDSFYLIGLNEQTLANIEDLLEHKDYTLADYVKFGYKTEVTPDELEYFRKYGGAPWLNGHTVVFGQVIEGIEYLDDIIRDHLEDDSLEVIIESIETD